MQLLQIHILFAFSSLDAFLKYFVSARVLFNIPGLNVWEVICGAYQLIELPNTGVQTMNDCLPVTNSIIRISILTKKVSRIDDILCVWRNAAMALAITRLKYDIYKQMSRHYITSFRLKNSKPQLKNCYNYSSYFWENLLILSSNAAADCINCGKKCDCIEE